MRLLFLTINVFKFDVTLHLPDVYLGHTYLRPESSRFLVSITSQILL